MKKFKIMSFLLACVILLLSISGCKKADENGSSAALNTSHSQSEKTDSSSIEQIDTTTSSSETTTNSSAVTSSVSSSAVKPAESSKVELSVKEHKVAKWYSAGTLKVTSMQELLQQEPQGRRDGSVVAVYLPKKLSGHSDFCQAMLNTLTGKVFCLNHFLANNSAAHKLNIAANEILPLTEACRNGRYAFQKINPETYEKFTPIYIYDETADTLEIYNNNYIADFMAFSEDVKEIAFLDGEKYNERGLPYHSLSVYDFVNDKKTTISQDEDGNDLFQAFITFINFSPKSSYVAYSVRNNSGPADNIAVWSRKTNQSEVISSFGLSFSGDEKTVIYPDKEDEHHLYWKKTLGSGQPSVAFKFDEPNTFSHIAKVSYSGKTQVIASYKNITDAMHPERILLVQDGKIKLTKQNVTCFMTDKEHKYLYSYSLRYEDYITVTNLETLEEFTVGIDDLTALRVVQMAYHKDVGATLSLSPDNQKIFVSFYPLLW